MYDHRSVYNSCLYRYIFHVHIGTGLQLYPDIFEVVSAFGTVGLSTGITPELCTAGKLVIISVMFIGRLGAFTLLTMWISRPESAIRYSEESIAIG